MIWRFSAGVVFRNFAKVKENIMLLKNILGGDEHGALTEFSLTA